MPIFNRRLLQDRVKTLPSFFGVQAPSVQLEEPELTPDETVFSSYSAALQRQRERLKKTADASGTAADIFIGNRMRAASEELPIPEGFKEFFARKYKAVDLMNDWVMGSMANNLGKEHISLKRQALEEWKTLTQEQGLRTRKAADIKQTDAQNIYTAQQNAIDSNQKSVDSIAESWKAQLEGRNKELEVLTKEAELAKLDPAYVQAEKNVTQFWGSLEKKTSELEDPTLSRFFFDLQNQFGMTMPSEEDRAAIGELVFQATERSYKRKNQEKIPTASQKEIEMFIKLRQQNVEPSEVLQAFGKKALAVYEGAEARPTYAFIPTGKQKAEMFSTLDGIETVLAFRDLWTAAKDNLDPAQKPGLIQRFIGLVDKVAGSVGSNPEAKVYEDLLQVQAMRQAVEIQGSANLSDKEREAALGELVTVFATDAEAKLKFERSLESLGRKLANQFERSPKLGSPGSTQERRSGLEFVNTLYPESIGVKEKEDDDFSTKSAYDRAVELMKYNFFSIGR